MIGSSRQPKIDGTNLATPIGDVADVDTSPQRPSKIDGTNLATPPGETLPGLKIDGTNLANPAAGAEDRCSPMRKRGNEPSRSARRRVQLNRGFPRCGIGKIDSTSGHAANGSQPLESESTKRTQFDR
jgi:hypothetical protein